jgi:hypothetical protein
LSLAGFKVQRGGQRRESHCTVYALLISSINTRSACLPTYLPTYLPTHPPTHPSIHPSIYLWPYSPLLDLSHFLSFLIYTQSVGLLGQGISLPQGRYLHAEQHKHRINAHRHPCLESDPNPRSQGSRGAETVHTSDRAATVIGINTRHQC